MFRREPISYYESCTARSRVDIFDQGMIMKAKLDESEPGWDGTVVDLPVQRG